MALQIESSSSDFVNGAGITNVVPKPSGVVEGDLLLGFHSSGRGDATGTTLPGGFTKVRDFDHTTGGPGGGWGWKIAGPSEPSTYTFTLIGATGSGNRSALMLRISGLDPATPINAEGISPEHNSTPFQDPRVVTPAPDILTTVKGCLILRMVVASVSGVLDRAGPSTYWAISGVTASLVVDEPTPVASQATDNSGGAIFSEDALQVAAGQTGTAGLTVDLDDANTNQIVRAFTLSAAIAPFPTSGAGGMASPSPGVGKKPITKADVLAAREQAIAMGAKVKTKFDQRRR